MTSSYADIVNDPQIELVVECMGGVEPAHTFILEALSAGKHVVTSNKAVVAEHFAEFVEAANAHDAGLLVEASVGGGIPWIASIIKARRIDAINSFCGIMRSHSESITAEFDRPITPEEAREILSSAPGVKVVDDPGSLRYPMPLDTSDQDLVFVGRIRRDTSAPEGVNSLTFFCCGDQIRKGAATNAVQIAEYLA